MRKYLSLVLILIFLSVMLSGCFRPSKFDTDLGKQFNLYVGQTAVIESENLSIKFLEVIADSRCASDVECVQAGSVSCQVEISTGGGQPSQLTLMEPPGDQTYQGFEITFTVKPYPISTRKLTPNDYYMVMTVR